MTIVCSWCFPNDATPGASHGMCADHALKIQVRHIAIPRVQGVIARLRSENYYGQTLRNECVDDLKRVLEILEEVE